MPDYAYRLVYLRNSQRVVEDFLTPHAFAGSAEEFGRATLLDVMASRPAVGSEFAGVNVWHADREGVGEAATRAAVVGTDDLDTGPFPANLLAISHFTYYVVSADDVIDEILGGNGAEVVQGVPQGLIVPGSGPALKIRTGHQFGYITVDVSVHDSAPAADLDAWEAVEQATIRPRSDVRICDWLWSVQGQFPDLRGDRSAHYLTIRVSARGRDSKSSPPPSVNPRRVPVEHHQIQAWPVAETAAREVLKRDETTRYWESALG